MYSRTRHVNTEEMRADEEMVSWATVGLLLGMALLLLTTVPARKGLDVHELILLSGRIDAPRRSTTTTSAIAVRSWNSWSEEVVGNDRGESLQERPWAESGGGELQRLRHSSLRLSALSVFSGLWFGIPQCLLCLALIVHTHQQRSRSRWLQTQSACHAVNQLVLSVSLTVAMTTLAAMSAGNTMGIALLLLERASPSLGFHCQGASVAGVAETCTCRSSDGDHVTVMYGTSCQYAAHCLVKVYLATSCLAVMTIPVNLMVASFSWPLTLSSLFYRRQGKGAPTKKPALEMV